jgi:hypothetical protein
METMTSAWSRWWFVPQDTARIHVLRLVAYLFVLVEAAWTSGWIDEHRDLPAGLYRPLLIARLLPLPVPTATWVTAAWALMVIASLLALAATVRRSTYVGPMGWLVAGSYLWWMTIGMSYGKVDHDRFAFLILLFTLPTVEVVPRGEDRHSEAAGWAVRMVQVGVVATYALSAWAKVRFGGWDWANGATLTRAVVRRGTAVADLALDHPGLLHGIQWATVLLEAATVLILWAAPRCMPWIVAGLVAFHLATFATLGIIFLPHLVALTALLPLERLVTERRPARSLA